MIAIKTIEMASIDKHSVGIFFALRTLLFVCPKKIEIEDLPPMLHRLYVKSWQKYSSLDCEILSVQYA